MKIQLISWLKHCTNAQYHQKQKESSQKIIIDLTVLTPISGYLCNQCHISHQ